MITPGDIARLCIWLTANGIDWRGPKGDYQLLQIKVKDGYGAICTNSKGVVSSPPSVRELLRDFSMGKPCTAQSSKDSAIGGRQAAIANDEFLSDLRDDFAMRAAQGMLANSGGPIQSSDRCGWELVNCNFADVAQQAYAFADAMLEARKVRT
ncbi:MAG: hypothetical protein V4749_17865 [Pseudomonadota bacterium]